MGRGRLGGYFLDDRDRRGLRVLFGRQLICLSLGESLVGRHGLSTQFLLGRLREVRDKI